MDAGRWLRCDEVTSTARISAPVPGSADGHGSFKSKAQMRSVAREWQKQAMGRQLAPQSAKGFLAQGLGMGIPASQTVITDPEKAKAFTASVLALREREAELLRGEDENGSGRKHRGKDCLVSGFEFCNCA